MLRHLPLAQDPNVLVGTDTSDDAAVYKVSEDLAIAATVDYITPVVEDPYLYGAIAAANALSDIYAMGARPLFALNLVNFPKDRLPLETLTFILQGGADKAMEAGVPIIGGHSIDDPEPKYGLSVVGTVHPQKVVANVGAKPGDVLVLTKPLGIGIITTGIKRDLAPPQAVREAVSVMMQLNRAASEVMVEIGVDAATDVTGFGLLGHLWEMVRGSGVAARVYSEKVPVIRQVWDLVAQKCVPGGTLRNRDWLNEFVQWGPGTSNEEQLVLCDAQTSGGLLIAVPPSRAQALIDSLRARGTIAAASVGEIIEPPCRIEVR